MIEALKNKIRNGFLDAAIIGGGPLSFSYERMKNLINKRHPEISGWISLQDINSFVPNSALEAHFAPKRVRKPELPSFIIDGNWDLEKRPIDNEYKQISISYRSVMQIFEQEMHYRECDEYKQKMKLIEETGHSARGKNLDELDRYFVNLISLKNDIEIHGYKTQKELGHDSDDEIGVFVGRSGEILKAEDKFCGTHRFAIAKYLQLPHIYVTVVAVHEEWANNNIKKFSDRSIEDQLFSQKERSQ